MVENLKLLSNSFWDNAVAIYCILLFLMISATVVCIYAKIQLERELESKKKKKKGKKKNG